MENQIKSKPRKNLKTIFRVIQATNRFNMQHRYSMPIITSPFTRLMQLQQNSYNALKKKDHLPQMNDHSPKMNDHLPKMNDHLPKMSDSMMIVMQSLRNQRISYDENDVNDIHDNNNVAEDDVDEIYDLRGICNERNSLINTRNPSSYPSSFPSLSNDMSNRSKTTVFKKYQENYVRYPQLQRQKGGSMCEIVGKNKNDYFDVIDCNRSSTNNGTRLSSVSESENVSLACQHSPVRGYQHGSVRSGGRNDNINDIPYLKKRRDSLVEFSNHRGFSTRTRNLLERTGHLEDKIQHYRNRHSDILSPKVDEDDVGSLSMRRLGTGSLSIPHSQITNSLENDRSRPNKSTTNITMRNRRKSVFW